MTVGRNLIINLPKLMPNVCQGRRRPLRDSKTKTETGKRSEELPTGVREMSDLFVLAPVCVKLSSLFVSPKLQRHSLGLVACVPVTSPFLCGGSLPGWQRQCS